MNDKYTVEEIRAAAIEEYKHATPAGAEVYADGLVSRLTRPAIHPSVPVRLVWENGHTDVMTAGAAPRQPPGYTTTVLIPAPLVMEWSDEWAHGSYIAGPLSAWLEAKIAYYTEHGDE